MKAIVHREEDRTKAVIVSLIFHAAILAMLILYRFAAPDTTEDLPQPIVIELGGGDDAAAGEPDRGQGDVPAPQGQQMEDPTVTEEAEEPVAKPEPTPPSTPPPAAPQTKPNAPKITTTEDPTVAAIKKAQQEEAKRKQQETQDRIRREQDEKRRIAEAAEREKQAAAAKAQKEAADKAAKKGKFGSTFGSGPGGGQGNTGKPGNQGVPGGTGNNPLGTSPGSGGGSGGGNAGGFGDRKAVQRVAAAYNSTQQGTVRVKVCINSQGTVVSADPTQSGSTTTDGKLRAAATSAAKRWKFEASPGADTQCGWIDFNFIMK